MTQIVAPCSRLPQDRGEHCRPLKCANISQTRGKVGKMATTNGKLEALRKRASEIQAQIEKVEAKEKGKKRKEENRVKILVGVGIIADTLKNPETRAGVVSVLDRAITAPKDREFLKTKGWL